MFFPVLRNKYIGDKEKMFLVTSSLFATSNIVIANLFRSEDNVNSRVGSLSASPARDFHSDVGALPAPPLLAANDALLNGSWTCDAPNLSVN